MSANRRVIAVAAAGITLATVLSVTPARGEPGGCPPGSTADAGGCSARLASVTADISAGSLTGTPVGGTAPITVFANLPQYLHSTGFGAAPDAVQQWDGIIDRVGGPPADYGEAKGAAFAPRELNRLATEFPPGTLVIRGIPDPSDSHVFVLQSIQPVA